MKIEKLSSGQECPLMVPRALGLSGQRSIGQDKRAPAASPVMGVVDLESRPLHEQEEMNDRTGGLSKDKSCLMRVVTRCGACCAYLRRQVYFQKVPHEKLGDEVTL
jgi:hypothetical protein